MFVRNLSLSIPTSIPKLIHTDKAVRTLVEDRPNFMAPNLMFITVSPNPNVKHEVFRELFERKRKVKLPYKMLKHSEQKEYLEFIIRNCYLSIHPDAELVGCYELNKQGNLHAHFLFKTKLKKNDYNLEILRREILNCPEVLKNMKQKDWMNNIVYLNVSKNDILTYLDKDHEESATVFGNYYV